MSKFGNHIRKVVILGSGVMGSQIAAHCINAGLNVHLLDMKSEESGDPNKRVTDQISRLRKIRPSPLGILDQADQIIPGNFDDDLEVIRNADWVCEVVVERMDIKKKMMQSIESYWQPGTIVSSNTSGLALSDISEDCSEEFRSHFLGTHFFNPPRYMKLLEVIPTKDTDPSVTETMVRFCEKILGKGIVRCYDTPNFIANRLGVFSMASIMPWFFDGRMRAEEIDFLTGTLTGYSKAATFRTADIVGLDILSYVAENLYPAVPDDERRNLFKLPDGVNKMISRGFLGNKSGQGFYKKVQSGNGAEYHVLNPDTMEYEPQQEVNFEPVLIAKKTYPTPEERLRFLVHQDHPASRFLWDVHCDLLLYVFNRFHEITESVEDIDRAMQWGYNWELGPFQRWDAIGVIYSVERMESEGRVIPEALRKMADAGRDRFYQDDSIYDPVTEESVSLTPPASDAVTVFTLSQAGKTVWENDEAGLWDMGDGVALFEFRTKQQTLGFKLVESVRLAMDEVSKQFDALVIGHDHENFSYGANLAEIVQAVEKGNFDLIESAILNFQQTARGLSYLPFPVVGAVSGRTLGGGVEFMMHCDKVISSYELYCGLVEAGVGLVPAGGGTKELLRRALVKTDRVGSQDPFPFLREAFKTIGMARVSDSAPAAQKLDFLQDSDVIIMNRDYLLLTAKKHARILAEAGYTPPFEPDIRLVGKTGYSTLKLMLSSLYESGEISEYDVQIAEKVAYIMTGGDLSEPQFVPESYVLKLEREAISDLLKDRRTLARMKHMLSTGKPLRN